MIRQRIIVLFLIVLSFRMSAQSPQWGTTGMPEFGSQILCIYTDTITNELYVTGEIRSSPTSFSNYYICKYNGSSWTTIGIFDDEVFSLARYNGDLIAAGPFHNINGVPFFSIARYDGTNWYPMGNFDVELERIRVIGTDLYAMGAFSSVDGVPANGIAKWSGSSWSDVYGFTPDNTGHILLDVAIYKGNTYVCGIFSNPALGLNNIAEYKAGIWQNVAGGVVGGWTDLPKMVTYHNELYVLGCIVKPDGNIGNGIQKWNDTVWTEVGAGVQDFTNSYGSPGTIIMDGVVHNDELYVAGCFGYAGHVPAYCAAKWDGLKWCGLATNGLLHNKTLALNFYNDTLYLGIGDDTLNGIHTNRIVKYIAGNYVDTCSIAYTGVTELTNDDFNFNIYPNPTTDNLTLEFEDQKISYVLIEIKNVLGQTLYSEEIKNGIGKQSRNIDVSTFLNGVYLVQLKCNNTISSKKFVKE